MMTQTRREIKNHLTGILTRMSDRDMTTIHRAVARGDYRSTGDSIVHEHLLGTIMGAMAGQMIADYTMGGM